MPNPQLLSVEESVALGVKLSQAETAASSPAPFSSNITRELKKMHPDCHFIECSSLSASLNAAIGASLGGKRTFVPMSMPSPIEDIFTLSYMRLPVVMANISRPIGTYSIRHDHSDISTLMDAGCLVFMPESNQEIVEAIIQAYRVSEDEKVMLPSVVNIDVANYSESIIPAQEAFARRFVGRFRAFYGFDKKPKYYAAPDDNYSELKKQQHKAIKNSMEAIEKTSRLWHKKFGRALPLIEPYKLEDADFAVVISGFHSTTAKAAVDRLRGMGKKAGLLRIRVLRPWPSALVENALKSAKSIAVFDQSVSPGRFGTIYREINDKSRCSNIISQGTHPSEKDFIGIFERLEKSGKDEILWA